MSRASASRVTVLRLLTALCFNMLMVRGLIFFLLHHAVKPSPTFAFSAIHSRTVRCFMGSSTLAQDPKKSENMLDFLDANADKGGMSTNEQERTWNTSKPNDGDMVFPWNGCWVIFWSWERIEAIVGDYDEFEELNGLPVTDGRAMDLIAELPLDLQRQIHREAKEHRYAAETGCVE